MEQATRQPTTTDEEKYPEPRPYPPCKFSIPDAAECKEYEKIPADVKAAIERDKSKADRAAEEAWQKAKDAAEDAKGSAQAIYDKAQRVWQAAKSNLDKQKEFDEEEVCEKYQGCVKGCPEEEISCDKKAVCISQLKLDLAKIETNYLTKLQEIEKTWSGAQKDWTKAGEEYDQKIKFADQVLDEQKKDAELKRRLKLSEALEKVCRR